MYFNFCRLYFGRSLGRFHVRKIGERNTFNTSLGHFFNCLFNFLVSCGIHNWGRIILSLFFHNYYQQVIFLLLQPEFQDPAHQHLVKKFDAYNSSQIFFYFGTAKVIKYLYFRVFYVNYPEFFLIDF